MISFIVASIGRSSLVETLASIECWPGDEIIVIGTMGMATDHRVRFVPYLSGGDWGHTERNFAMPLARGAYIAHIDDDDVYAAGTRALMADAIRLAPHNPTIFRMRFPNGLTLWQDTQLRCGNVGTPMVLMPNAPEKFGTWGSFVGGDYHFLVSSGWKEEEYVWRPEVIALLGHNV